MLHHSFVFFKSRVFSFWIIVAFQIGCTNKGGNTDLITTLEESHSLEESHELAINHCGSCHLFPVPELLDKKTWQNNVLPQMSLHMGIFFDGHHYRPQIPNAVFEKDAISNLAKKLQLYPDSSVVRLEEWLAIEKFYLSKAPQQLSSIDRDRPTGKLNFAVSSVPFRFSNSYSSVSFVEFDDQRGIIYLGDKRTKSLYILDKNFNQLDQIETGSVPIKVIAKGEDLYILTMGTFEAAAESKGKLILYKEGKKEALIENLNRPVDFLMTNFMESGTPEFLIAEFGSLTGGLNLYFKNLEEFSKREIYKGAGTLQLMEKDLNQDGKLEIVALIAHGEEVLVNFAHSGNGVFERKTLIQMPPVYGSSFFTFEDINGNGKEELLYVNGDNADLSPILKPYHGVRIFEDIDGVYKQNHFLPVNGAYKVIAHDFNDDGLKDLAVVSFFPDFHKYPEEGFIVFEQKEGGSFSPIVLPMIKESRWIDIVLADLDGNGRKEILLAAHLLSQAADIPNSLRSLWAQKRHALIKISFEDID
ncbi:FG-GAP repeat domain-containing protein [Pleomorphovibrio marinus]|uniref:FG-GAP repeat domain-containing protein n=1 Tax=Pleomorphovibrio marinus TaxID=2164132 RepID=UPI000E0A341C|nr:VCBS repeat-containing protein [Pleomorphovibrio marinus]